MLFAKITFYPEVDNGNEKNRNIGTKKDPTKKPDLHYLVGKITDESKPLHKRLCPLDVL